MSHAPTTSSPPHHPVSPKGSPSLAPPTSTSSPVVGGAASVDGLLDTAGEHLAALDRLQRLDAGPAEVPSAPPTRPVFEVDARDLPRRHEARRRLQNHPPTASFDDPGGPHRVEVQASPAAVQTLVDLDRRIRRASSLVVYNILGAITAAVMVSVNRPGPFPTIGVVGLFGYLAYAQIMGRMKMHQLEVKGTRRLGAMQHVLTVAVAIWALGSSIEVLTGAPGLGLLSVAGGAGGPSAAAAAGTGGGLGVTGDAMVQDLTQSLQGLMQTAMIAGYILTFVSVLIFNVYVASRIVGVERALKVAHRELPEWLLQTIRPKYLRKP